jgi:hypothetical protein
MTETEIKRHERLSARWAQYEGFGESHTCGEWSRLLPLNRWTLRRYLEKGLTVEEIVRLRGLAYPTK